MCYNLPNNSRRTPDLTKIPIPIKSWLQKADLAIADLSINYDREKAVDFTMPFMNTGR